MAVSVRTLIREMQTEVRDTPQLAPVRAAELLVKLTGLYGNVVDEVRAADLEYNAVLLEALATDEAATRAKIRAQASPQYRRAREAKDAERLCLELIRSLKKYVALQQDEMRLGK